MRAHGFVIVNNFGWKLHSFSGRVAMEGKVEHKFDMKPHNENIEEYGKLCRERTNKSMIKNRQIQVAYFTLIFSFCYFFHFFSCI